jgi:hypothetical protein
VITHNHLKKDFTEHEFSKWQTISNKISIVDFSHRFMFEQRWIGRYTNANLSSEDDYVFVKKDCYMFRMHHSSKGNHFR